MSPDSPNVATLVAPVLNDGNVEAARARLIAVGMAVDVPLWLQPGRAVDLGFWGDVTAARHALVPIESVADVIVQPRSRRRPRLFVSDMDSTMITVECIDELADYAGIKAEIAAVTERAMRGDLNFADALRARVALLNGLDATAIEQCLAERVRAMPGAAALVATLIAEGCHTVLVSGGFTHFAEPVAAELGFDTVHANRLAIAGRRLTGQVEGALVDADAKRRILIDTADRFAIPMIETLAIGDGANDLPMVAAAGLGVAFRAKPVLAAAASARIRHSDLTVLLHAAGIPVERWRAGKDCH